MRNLWMGLFFTGLVMSAGTSIAQDTGGRPSVHAFRAPSPPVIDGVMDEPWWADAEAITDFYQRKPLMGEKATFPVEMRIAYDPENIYIGFAIHCGSPDMLSASVLERDGGVNSYDDHLGFRLDTLNNDRDLYYFYINPNGTKKDGHASDEGAISDDDWDGVWDVKVQLIEDGWAGEIRLPLYNFRYKENEDGVWGFAALVYVIETQENVTWPFMGKNSRKPSQFGKITGLKGLKKDNPLVLIPYVVQGSKFGRHEKVDTVPPSWRAVDDTWESDVGLDLRYRPASNIETNVTFNPDFATVEADQFLFNLSLDELQYPEKRPFFTEGQDRFETPIQLLYTRRIGLGENEVIGGAKVHGNAGQYSFGVLEALTGDGLDPENNYTAFRLRRNLLTSSSVGFLGVSKDDVSSGYDGVNRAAGVDLNLQLNAASRLTGFAAASEREGEGGEGTAFRFDYAFNDAVFSQRDNVTVGMTLDAVSEDFDISDIGYIGRTSLDRRGGELDLGYEYWIKQKGINLVSADGVYWYYSDFDGNRKVQDGTRGRFSFQTIGLIQPGIILENSMIRIPGTGIVYDNTRREVSIDFGPYPRFMADISYRTGNNYGGEISYVESNIKFRPSVRMTVSTSYAHLERDPFESADPSSTNDIVNLGMTYLFTPDLYWRILAQSSTEDDLALVNSLIRYEFRPGSVFFLSYKETRDDSLDDFTATDRQLIAKVSYYFHR